MRHDYVLHAIARWGQLCTLEYRTQGATLIVNRLRLDLARRSLPPRQLLAHGGTVLLAQQGIRGPMDE